MAIFLFIILLGLVLILFVEYRIEFEKIPYIVLNIVLLVLYVSGLFGVTHYILPLLSIATSFFSFRALENGREIYKVDLRRFNLSKVLYLIVPLFLYLRISDDYRFTGWDEFSHWLPSVKQYFATWAFSSADSAIHFKHYPVGQNIIQSIGLAFLGWSDKNILFSQNLYIFSALLFLSSLLNVTVCLRLVFCIVSLASVSVLQLNAFTLIRIYSDLILSLAFTIAFIFAVRAERNKFNFALLALFLLPVVTIKEIGFLLALFVVVTYFIVGSVKSASHFSAEMVDSVSFKQHCVNSISLLGFILLVFLSWSFYIKIKAIGVTSPIVEFSTLFKGEGLIRLGGTVSEFFNRIFVVKYINSATSALKYNLTLFQLLACTFFATLIFGVFCIKNRIMNVCSAVTLYLIATAYTIFLLYAYLFIFEAAEGIVLASFERYVATIVFSCIVFLIFIFFDFISRFRAVIQYLASLIFAIFISMVLPESFYDELYHGVTISAQQREPVESVQVLVDQVYPHLKPNDSVYIISQNSSGYEKYIFNSMLVPYKSTWWCWSLGAKYTENDLWTCDISLHDAIRGYNYLVLYNADSQFWAANGYMFPEDSLGSISGVFKYDSSTDRFMVIPFDGYNK